MNRRAARVVAFFLVVFFIVVPPAGGQEGPDFGQEVRLSGVTELAAREVYRLAVQHALLKLNYEKSDAEPPAKAGELTAQTYLVRQGEGVHRELIVGLKTYATQDPRVYLWGAERQGDARTPNPDAAALAALAEQAAQDYKSAPRTFTPRELSNETYQLSCIRSEDCIEILKSLGYTTTPPTGQVQLAQLPAVFAMPAKQPVSFVGGKDLTVSQKVLPDETVSVAENRLMIVYHSSQAAEVGALKDLLSQTIDVPADQVLIEGMVIELREESLKELGVTWQLFGDEHWKATFLASDDQVPFVFTYDPQYTPPADLAERIKATIRMVLQEGKGEVLSSPSVVVLNNRNAKIEVVQEVPVFSQVITQTTTEVKVQFKTVGIILNIKPRISQDYSTVAMQIAAEVSEAPKEEFIVVAGQNIAPVIYRRLVETVARVQDNTPFIIGGLIRNESADTVDRVPILSRIPILGALFQSSSRRLEKREVIIVLTPRVLRTHGSQRPALPKDTARFDFLDNQLFRNSYRIKGDDVRDWGFLQNNPMVLEAMGEARALSLRHPEHAKRLPISELASGTVPGEDALVTRMLYEIIRYKLKSFEALKDENLVYFQKDPSKPAGFRVERLWRTLREVSPEVAHEEDPSKVLDYYFGRTEYPRKVLVVRFKVEAGGGMGGALKTPVAETGWLELAGPEDKDATDEVDKWTLEHNKLRDKEYTYGELGFVLNTARDLERLKTAIVLREVEQVNNIEELLTLRNFHVGRRIVIPELDSASPRTFLVDHQIAELYFVSDYYYTVLQAKLERAYSVLEQALASEAE